jgi:hypothetical protein
MSSDFTITKQFVLGGKAIFTVHNPGGQHYTFMVQAANFDDDAEGTPDRFFCYLLTGPDNTGDYTYLGMLDVSTGETFATKKSTWKDALAKWRRLFQARQFDAAKQAEQAIPLPVRVLRWALMKIVWPGQSVPEGYGINGEGRCGRCGKPLTRPEGIDPQGFRFGFGPTCWAKVVGG